MISQARHVCLLHAKQRRLGLLGCVHGMLLLQNACVGLIGTMLPKRLDPKRIAPCFFRMFPEHYLEYYKFLLKKPNLLLSRTCNLTRKPSKEPSTASVVERRYTRQVKWHELTCVVLFGGIDTIEKRILECIGAIFDINSSIGVRIWAMKLAHPEPPAM